ncbi:MAG TPA: sensor domain-containing diguanylate cyclase, partial [Acidimicrobiales bacterium]
VVFVAVLWAAAFTTASFSALNERELRRRRADMEALAEMAAALEALTDPVTIAEVLLERVCDALGFHRGLVLAGPPEGRLRLLAQRGLEGSPHDPAQPVEADPRSVVNQALSSWGALVHDSLDVDADPWLVQLLGWPRRLMVAPLSGESRPVGVLVLDYPRPAGARVPRRVAAMVERFASYGGLALRNAWLLAQLTRRAATDGLTGIANRRSFDTNLSREIGRARRSGDPVSLVMIDIDHFKGLNDEKGHQVGDGVLRRVAGLLHDHCRDFDTAARYGGEEFALILPSCPADTGAATADRMRIMIAETESELGVTVSAGVASYPTDAEDAFSLIGAADQALYLSKRSGRNRVTCAQEIGAAHQAAPRRSPLSEPDGTSVTS